MPSASVAASPTDAAPDDAASYADAIVAATNQARSARGLAELTPSACATEQALGRAKALVGAALEHAPLTGVISACSPPAGMAAENLSRAAARPADVVTAWLGSPGHANNLLSPQLTQLGVGCVPEEDGGQREMLCSQVFLG